MHTYLKGEKKEMLETIQSAMVAAFCFCTHHHDMMHISAYEVNTLDSKRALTSQRDINKIEEEKK